MKYTTKLNEPVTVVCYGVRHSFDTRTEAIEYYAEREYRTAKMGKDQGVYARVCLNLHYTDRDEVTDELAEEIDGVFEDIFYPSDG